MTDSDDSSMTDSDDSSMTDSDHGSVTDSDHSSMSVAHALLRATSSLVSTPWWHSLQPVEAPSWRRRQPVGEPWLRRLQPAGQEYPQATSKIAFSTGLSCACPPILTATGIK
jgi:hypothetical protein